jgi:hypothetical protein
MIKNEKIIIRYIPDFRNYDTKHLLKGGMHREGKKLLTVRKQNGAVIPYLPNGEPFLTDKEIKEIKGVLGTNIDLGLGGSFWKDNENLQLVLVNGDVVLDMKNVYACLKYKIAQQYDMVIAPSWKERDKLPTYRWAIIKENEQTNSSIEELSFKKRAYKAYGKYEDNRDYLTYIYYKMEDKLVAPNVTMDTIHSWFNDLIDKKVEIFVKFVEDELLYEKSLVFAAWQEGIIQRSNNGFIYDNGEKSVVLTTDDYQGIDSAAAFLSELKNQHVKLEIEGNLNNKRSKK